MRARHLELGLRAHDTADHSPAGGTAPHAEVRVGRRSRPVALGGCLGMHRAPHVAGDVLALIALLRALARGDTRGGVASVRGYRRHGSSTRPAALEGCGPPTREIVVV